MVIYSVDIMLVDISNMSAGVVAVFPGVTWLAGRCFVAPVVPGRESSAELSALTGNTNGQARWWWWWLSGVTQPPLPPS